MLVLLLAGGLGAWTTRPGPRPSVRLSVEQIPLRVAGWTGRELGPFDHTTLDELQPDACLNREYLNAAGLPVYLAVVYGHRKSSFHSPGFCLLGGGWNITGKSRLQFRPAGGAAVTANRFVLSRGGERAVVVYYYVQGKRATPSWVLHQAYLAWDRLRVERPVGALVRLTVPAGGDAGAATRRGVELLEQLHPALVGVLGA